MVREPIFDEAMLNVAYEALLAHQHHLTLTHDPTLAPTLRVCTRTVNELSEALFGEMSEPLVLPDFVDHEPEALYATESDRLWNTGPGAA
jgi:hypothetical protein